MSGATLTLNPKVNYRTYSWEEMVLREWGPKWGIPDICYEFSNGATRWSTDLMQGGIYATLYGNLLISDASKYPDMFDGYLLQDNGGHILTEG